MKITKANIYKVQDYDCEEFWAEYGRFLYKFRAYGHTDVIPVEELNLDDHPLWKEYLEKHDFIPKETYKINDRFLIESEEVILCESLDSECSLICLEDGLCYGDPVEVDNIDEVTMAEFKQMLPANTKWEKV